MAQNEPTSQILVLISSLNIKEFLSRIFMNDISSPRPSVGHESKLREVPPDFPRSVMDFFESRQRLLRKSQGIAQESGIDRPGRGPVIRQELSDGLVDALEGASYWLIWAAVLAGLALGIFAP
jgi:hypothetical protein